MLNIYKLFVKFLQFVMNLLFCLQIALMVLVFLTAAYWFFNLIGLSTFEFVAPVAEFISDMMRLFYHEDIEVGGVFIDGTLLLFDILALIFVLCITKFKYYINRVMHKLEYAIECCLNSIEKNFNKKLKQEVDEKIKKSNNVAILVNFEVKNMFVDGVWGGDSDAGVKEKAEDAFKIFYTAIKNISSCNVLKTDNKVLILSSDFSRVDEILNFVDLSINRIRFNMKKKKWQLFSYVALDVFSDKVELKKEVLPILEKLLNLRQNGEALCLGNFNLRYKLNQETLYTPTIKGSYNIAEYCDVFSLVKKS